jgi:hypothetical protein
MQKEVVVNSVVIDRLVFNDDKNNFLDIAQTFDL